jgi:hypothetical protein
MKRLLRATLFTAASVLVVAVALIAFLWTLLFRNACAREEYVLARDPSGRVLNYKFEACTTIGTTVYEAVELVSPSGRRKTIFRFEPADGMIRYHGIYVTGPLQPSATWTSPHSVKISIGTVADILEQRSQIGDVSVSYDIATNLHMERDVGK